MEAMAGNPWSVPRALPGSHDLKLMEEALDHWLKSGKLRSAVQQITLEAKAIVQAGGNTQPLWCYWRDGF